MSTIYDWLTVAIFAGLVVLFLQRSSGDREPRDSMWQYLAASIGCAVANYLGNNAIKNGAAAGQPDLLGHVLAVVTLVGTLGYILFALKPFKRYG